MKANNKILLAAFFLITAVFSTAFSQDLVPAVVISTASKTVPSIYRPANLRDPMIVSPVFVSQTENRKLIDSKQTQVQVSSFTIKNLVLTGIIEYSDKKEALMKDKFTGMIYMLKGGFLYDGKKERVRGIKGSIKGKQVTLVSDEEKDAPVELFIKDIFSKE